ncbi:MAG: hypothetical protein NTV00_13495 [Methylococcales bacterium]|nr:hypothetical protein [Methylococcales bacterium]
MHSQLKTKISHVYVEGLDHSSALRYACFVVPVVFGFYSMLLGQDANWDLLNYHFYNPYAWLNNRIGLDVAPAQLQSYFNPLLDVPYFEMATHWSARWVGFTMGAFHGLIFILLLGITRQILPVTLKIKRNRYSILLASACCITAAFISELGNTMGDNATALFVLAALFILLKNWDVLGIWTWQSSVIISLAGIVMGFGVGLKLTNAIYAVALCISCMTLPINWMARLRVAFVFGLGVLLGISLSAGFWFIGMWHWFKNPLFPQFNSIFNNPFAASTFISDTRWLPKGWLETIFWPFIFALHPKRVGESPVYQIGWPILHLLFIAWGYTLLRKRFSRNVMPNLEPKAAFLLFFIAVGYVIWMKLFSIYRYIVPIELLTPLAIWILLHHLLGVAAAQKMAGRILKVGALVVLVGTNSWGHKSWSQDSFRVDAPILQNPERTIILLVGGSPMAWMIPFFQKPIAFASLASNFPEGSAYAAHIRSMMSVRSDVYMIADAKTNFRLTAVTDMNAAFNTLGLTRSDVSCRALGWALKTFNIHANVQEFKRVDGRCALGVLPQDNIDIVAVNRIIANERSQLLERYGLKAEPNTCEAYETFVGERLFSYQLCRVSNR